MLTDLLQGILRFRTTTLHTPEKGLLKGACGKGLRKARPQWATTELMVTMHWYRHLQELHL